MKNVLITGASRGIGKAIVEGLTSEYCVYASARNEELLKELDVFGYFVCDLANQYDLKGLAEFIGLSKIDILINNAGEYVYDRIEDLNLEQLHLSFSVNSIAPLFLSGAAVPYMKLKKWGRIINIGSISGVMGEACATLYSATKASLIGFTKAAALELAQNNITVNTINPGWVDTELGGKSIEKSEFSTEEIIDTIPQKRFIEPCEIANFVKYLISDEAKGITGQSVNLCAGLSVGY